MATAYVLAIDVGKAENLGWADSEGNRGGYTTLEEQLAYAGAKLADGQPVALGFEAPIWVPLRDDLTTFNKSRGDLESSLNRPWSASAGCTVTAQALALMPLCLNVLKSALNGDIPATTVPATWFRDGGLLVWEAFVSGKHKGNDHADDADLAVKAFMDRGDRLDSDIPDQPAFSMAAAALLATKWAVRSEELTAPSIVISPE
ncbi:hypothetical protein GKC30_04455 [Pseudodesulfovibrio sp. F-1]|uniref:DUF429 domain-containing protein n=1 Tax=Pseudodesulfovibrio alkaliphilus TaxID=2661613 RepID=A0A7K1KLV9_9BACT|nr:hypothetical protein [Pseudodesulfovibrio alkaliphilus]MUM76882.1 hypothetical protein [Pseudodesulfovibrio alkaliphilus]